MASSRSGSQPFLVLAQDPGVKGASGERIFASVEVPVEKLAVGPTGYRVKVVDYDADAGLLYLAHVYSETPEGHMSDPFAARLPAATDPARATAEAALLADPSFHAQNVYALVMRTLTRFEYALGRRVHWGFAGHQLHVAPHAFVDANAFYSREDRSLMFGYFERDSVVGDEDRFVFTCLSHDIVVHETTHALIDGLRGGFLTMSGPDQAAFHEGFSDIVALLSVFSLQEVVELALTRTKGAGRRLVTVREGRRLVHGDALTAAVLANSTLTGLAEEFGRAIGNMRANALRRSICITPSRDLLNDPRYLDPHTRGEVLVAAVLHTVLHIWIGRIADLGTFDGGYYNLNEVAAEGAKVANHVLTMCIRALDYCPPLDLEFADFLSALLTVDSEVAPDDRRYHYRDTVFRVFASFGIEPPPDRTDADGCWRTFGQQSSLQYRRTNFESMLRDPEEVFRFIWENRAHLQVDERSYTEVMSVRPSVRLGPEGFLLRETICEYISRANIFGSELKSVCGVDPRPQGIETTDRLTIYGAGTLVFDQYGQLKYNISRNLKDSEWQRKRLEYLTIAPPEDGEGGNLFANLHRMRAYCAACDERSAQAPEKASSRFRPVSPTPSRVGTKRGAR